MAARKKIFSAVLIDDSKLMRNVVRHMLEAEDDLTVVGEAENGQVGLEVVAAADPDVVILDLEMPVMTGIEFLRQRRHLGLRQPVVILSSIAKAGARVTMDALALGAADFLLKPVTSDRQELDRVRRHLVSLARIYGRRHNRQTGLPPATARPTSAGAARQATPARRRSGRIELVAIGISTGGPNALRALLPSLSARFPAPIVVVQHMPPGFTREFADSLDRICALAVKEAADGDPITPGRILIAPGDRHVRIGGDEQARTVRLTDDEDVNGHKPSVDVLFASVATVYANRALALIMTGMGKDGAEGIAHIYAEGGITFAQDEDSCVVFGMPRAAIERGAVTAVHPLTGMAAAMEAEVDPDRGRRAGGTRNVNSST